jgi:hypothetical protein
MGTCANGTVQVVANNVVVDSAGGISTTGVSGQTGVYDFRNNAFVNVNHTNVSGTHYFINLNNTSATHALTITSNSNRYYQTTGVGFFRWVGGSSARSYAGYSSYVSDTSGQEAASSLGDPLWRGGLSPSTAAGFKLRLDSPLIRAGTCYLTTGCVHYDYEGKRARVPPDIGAFQRNDP